MDVFSYTKYYDILADWLLSEKRQRKHTAASVAQEIGIHPTFLSQVLSQKKDLSAEQWLNICELMKLSDIEKDFAHFLLQKNRAGTKTAKDYYQKKLEEILKRRLQLHERMKEHKQLTDAERSVFYSSWHYSALRLYCDVAGGQTIDSLGEKFALSRNRVESIMNFLCETGLCRLEAQKYLLGHQHVHVPAESPLVRQHHVNWRLRAIEGLEQSTPEQLHFTAPMSISKKDFALIRENVVKLIQSSVEIAKNSPSEDLAALTIDFFWP